MSVDFSKLGGGQSADTVTNPRDLFAVLPKKSPKYQYPRDVQAEVWSAWYARRDDRDAVIKMNTGSGKTVVGLLILKSCLNERRGPAVYITPDKYLTKQVIAEAQALGIEITTDEDSLRFRRGQAILVANIYKLLNGLSAFGVREEGRKIPIGSLLIDDAHACLDTTERQFTATIERTSPLFDEILAELRDDLAQQSSMSVLDIEAADPSKNLLVPFWAWQTKQSRISRILHGGKDGDELKFEWPLLSEVLPICNCVIGGSGIEISTRCIPVDAIPSFVQADRRIFMSATLADDSVLVTHFDASPNAAMKPITPTTANDVGDRLILIPQELNPQLSDDDLKSLCSGLSERHNVVVIVPSKWRAEYWDDVAERTLLAGDLERGIAELKKGHVGLVVIVNKYDGIDLPGKACRVLVLDGLPGAMRRIDRIEEAILHGTERQIASAIQKTEQGMGRGVRSADDFCAVILMGRSLTNQLYIDRAVDKLTPATRAQLELSLRLAEQLRGAGIGAIEEVIESVLKRDADWVAASRSALVNVPYDKTGRVSDVARRQRAAFNALAVGDSTAAQGELQEVVNQTQDPRTRGWLKQQLAEVINRANPVESQVILKSAIADNRLVLRPLAGVAYERLTLTGDSQAVVAAKRIKDSELSANHFVVKINGLLDDLRFEPGTSTRFERAVAEVGRLLGFGSQRPEVEFGAGPDVLWALGDLKFLVIECKNGAVATKIAKSDADQLSGSMNWFERNYDASCKPTPVMIHPSMVFERDANPPTETRVMTREKLSELRAALSSLARAIASKPFPPEEQEMVKQLTHHRLLGPGLLQAFTVRRKPS